MLAFSSHPTQEGLPPATPPPPLLPSSPPHGGGMPHSPSHLLALPSRPGCLASFLLLWEVLFKPGWLGHTGFLACFLSPWGLFFFVANRNNNNNVSI